MASCCRSVKPSIATTSTRSRQAFGRAASQVLNACLERPATMSSNRAGPVPSRTGVRSMITATYFLSRRVCRHMCSSTPITGTFSNRARVVDQDALPLGQDGVVRGIPRHAQSLGDPGDRQVPDDQTHQGPAHRCARQLRSRSRGPRKVLPPHAPTARTAVAPHPDQQRRGPPAERLVCQPARHRASCEALGPG